MPITNEQYAQNLRKLADKYAANPEIPQFAILRGVWDKQDCVSLLKFLGGKWKKIMPQDWNEAGYVQFESEDFAPLYITIPRDKVCKKTIQWDCEPLLSPEDHAELDLISDPVNAKGGE